jgi:hypothetical protein
MHRHDTFQGACAEAQRLVTQDRGKLFIVLKAEMGYRVDGMTVTNYTDDF